MCEKIYKLGNTSAGSGVTSFNGRPGVVVPENGDYDADKVAPTATRLYTTPAQQATWNAKQNALSLTELTLQIGTAKRFSIGSTSLGSHFLNVVGDSITPLFSFLDSSSGRSVTLNAGASTLSAPNTSAIFGGEVSAVTTMGIRSKSYFYSNVDGNINFTNNAGNGFGMLGLGPLTLAFPAFKRSGNSVQVRLGNDADFTFIDAKAFRVNGVLGPDGTFISADGKNITIEKGMIKTIA